MGMAIVYRNYPGRRKCTRSLGLIVFFLCNSARYESIVIIAIDWIIDVCISSNAHCSVEIRFLDDHSNYRLNHIEIVVIKKDNSTNSHYDTNFLDSASINIYFKVHKSIINPSYSSRIPDCKISGFGNFPDLKTL